MTLVKIICTPLKTLRSLKNSVLVISIFYRLTKVGRYFYTQISELSTLTGAFFIHKLAIRDSIDNGIDLHCHKKCSARSDAMNITEIHER